MSLMLAALPRRAVLLAVVGTLLALGCHETPRQVHPTREYPPIKLDSREVNGVVVDARPPAADPVVRRLSLSETFDPKLQARLAALASGVGPPLGVIVTVVAADEEPILDARGPMTRIRVRLELEIKLRSGLVLRRATTESRSDLPPDEATPEEVEFVLESTAIDAFDRYFADAKVLAAINRDLAAQSASD
jgi:hypothetical protein